MSDLEDRVRTGLRGYVTALVPDEIRVPGPPAPRRSRGAPLLVAAAIALLITAAIAVPRVLGAGPARPAAAPFSATDPSTGILLDGVTLKTLAGLTIWQLPGDGQYAGYCLDTTITATCNGIKLEYATPDAGEAPVGLPLPLTTAECQQQVTMDPVPIGGRFAWLYRDACPAPHGERLIWQLYDGTLEVSTPRGRLLDQATAVVADIDLAGWSNQATGPAVATSAVPTSGG